MKKEIWSTLGPSSMNDHVITRLAELGVSLFRINLSHTRAEDVAQVVQFIQARTDVPICLDTEGAQVRTSILQAGSVSVRENHTMRLSRDQLAGDANCMSLYPPGVVDLLVVGDLIRIDADVLVRVVAREAEGVVVRVLNGGTIGQSKAVTVLEREIPLSPLTEKDRQALVIGTEMGVRHVALSFANRASDVDAVRALTHESTKIVSKIECLNGLANLPEIADQSDALLIDRGDLSRQVNIERIPIVQKEIIRYARDADIPVYVATNLMESMITAPTPTRAEVNDVFNTLVDGADGLVLAAETAVGDYPVGAAMMVRRVINEYEQTSRWKRVRFSGTPLSSLVEPHGGMLVGRGPRDASGTSVAGLRRLALSPAELLDCAQIGSGLCSPLTGFMGRDELDSVLRRNRLLSDLPWTMPLILQVDRSEQFSVGEKIVLTDQAGHEYATLCVSDLYPLDLDELVTNWFGTTRSSHPGVAAVLDRGDYALAGEVELLAPVPSAYEAYELTPNQARMVFGQKGWAKVVGVPIYSAPQGLKGDRPLQALADLQADGVYVSPIVGPPSGNDVFVDLMFKSCQLALATGSYPRHKVVLGALSTYRRHCPLREVIFDAIRFKNLGCSHFLVPTNENPELQDLEADLRSAFKALDDLRITPIFSAPAESVTQETEAAPEAELAIGT